MTKDKSSEKYDFDEDHDSTASKAESVIDDVAENDDAVQADSNSEANMTAEEAITEEDSEDADRTQELESQVTEMNEKYIRLAAEHENYRKRMDGQLDRARKFAVDQFAREMLEVLESLDKACEIEIEGDTTPAVTAIREGVELTRKQMHNALKKFSIEEIVPQVGDVFDVNFHQAMTTQPSADIPANHIFDLFRKGYRIHDRLLRPAMVVVAAAIPEQPDDDGEPEQS